MEQIAKNKRLSELLLILWAGGAALLSYSLVYALRKPYTAASFEGLTFFGSDYKVAVTTIQILGYVIAKFFGIKIISELKRENGFRFFAGSAVLAELALVGFGLLDAPYNVIAMFVNGLSLGCMWGVIFSFIEGRKVTDILASLLGVSMVFSSGVAKSFGLFAMNDLHIDAFWMPAVIGGFALPLLVLMGYLLKRLPHPTAEDIALRNERVTLDAQGRKALFLKYAPILSLLFIGNFMLHRPDRLYRLYGYRHPTLYQRDAQHRLGMVRALQSHCLRRRCLVYRMFQYSCRLDLQEVQSYFRNNFHRTNHVPDHAIPSGLQSDRIELREQLPIRTEARHLVEIYNHSASKSPDRLQKAF